MAATALAWRGRGRVGSAVGRIARAALYAVVAVALSYALTWFSARSRTAGMVAGVIAFVLLSWAALQVMRAPSRARAAAGLAATLVVSFVGVLTLNELRPAAVAAVPLGSSEVAADPVGDCAACAPSEDVTGFGLRTVGGRTEAEVVLAAPPGPGTRLWLWTGAAPVHPVVLERGRDGWTVSAARAVPLDLGGLTIRAAGAHLVLGIDGATDLGGLAVVSDGGDRAPDVGVAAEPGRTAPPTGALADELAAALAEVQTGLPRLDETAQRYVRTALARQLQPGTYRYDLSLASHPHERLSAEVSVRFPELAQHLAVVRNGAQTVAQSTFAGLDAFTVCTWFTDGAARCQDRGGLADLPLGALVTMVREPGAVTLEEAPPRRVLGEVASCVRVVSSPAEGPPEGESCALADGVLAVNDNERTGVRLVLVERSADVDAGAFDRP